MNDDAFCPSCEPDNPAARYADTCLIHRVEDGLPVHYFDCERFNVTDYGTRQGRCDCTATIDVEDLIARARTLALTFASNRSVRPVTGGSSVESPALVSGSTPSPTSEETKK